MNDPKDSRMNEAEKKKDSDSANLYRAIGRSMVGRYAVYGTNLLSLMLLARVFTPATFGTIAALSVLLIFFQLMVEVGIGPAVINLNTLSHRDRDGLFGLLIFIGLLLAILFLLIGPVVEEFYSSPRLLEIVPLISISLVFYSAMVVPNALLLRDQKFLNISAAGVMAEVASTGATLILKNFLDPLHALACKGPISAAANFFLLYQFSSSTEFGRPRIGAKFSAIKPLLKFSVYQFAFNFVNYFSRNSDSILVGKYFGVASLGVYEKAYQLMRYPLLVLTFAMTPAIQPTVRKFASDLSKVEEIHRNFSFKLSLAGGFAGCAMYFLAEPAVLVIFGSQWMGIAPIVKIFAIAIPVQVVMAASGSFFQATQRADLLLSSGVMSSLVMISSIFYGIYRGEILTLSWMIVAALHLNFVQIYWLMYSKIYKKSALPFVIKMLPVFFVVCALVLASVL